MKCGAGVGTMVTPMAERLGNSIILSKVTDLLDRKNPYTYIDVRHANKPYIAILFLNEHKLRHLVKRKTLYTIGYTSGLVKIEE